MRTPTITQEKDRRTFVLLLMTDLRSYEIVLGKLLGSLLQIALLLLGMLPVLALLMLMGGIAPAQVAQAGLVIVEAEVGAVRFAVVGLGGVIVNQTYRGRGYARDVVEAAVSRARGFGPSFTLLFCFGDRAALYRKLGSELTTGVPRGRTRQPGPDLEV